MPQRAQQRAADASAVRAEAGVGTVAAVPASGMPGQTQTPARGYPSPPLTECPRPLALSRALGRFFPSQRPPTLPGLRRIPPIHQHPLAAAPPRTTPSATWTSTTCRLSAEAGATSIKSFTSGRSTSHRTSTGPRLRKGARGYPICGRFSPSGARPSRRATTWRRCGASARNRIGRVHSPFSILYF